MGNPCSFRNRGGVIADSGTLPPADLQDRWELRPLCLVRIHVRPRKALFAPDRCDDPPPIPLNHLDVTRLTKTDLENADEKQIEDIWDGSMHDCRELSALWTGETVFYKFWKEASDHRVVMGRVTRIQKTKRPPNIWPEV